LDGGRRQSKQAGFLPVDDFIFERPADLQSAADLLTADMEAKVVAGGMTLLPTMKLRLAQPSCLIDLSKIPSLTGIRSSDDRVVVGAMTRHVDVARDEITTARLPALAKLAGGIGDVQVRNRGTAGGSIANNDPSADYPAACLALDAVISTNARTLPATDFFDGLFATALDPNEIVTEISFRVPLRADYQKFRAVASGYAVVGVFVAEFAEGVRVAVTGAGADGVFRLAAAEEMLTGNFHPEALSKLEVSADGLMSEPSCLADYRAHLIGVMARRAVSRAIALAN
jgi:aerobic carbon-monoxide dehydrogenase medium subunit